MVEVKDGNIFTVETLSRIYKMTEELDQVYGVNHNQIDSIGHRTTRYLRAPSGGTLRAEPVMIGMPKTSEDAAAIRRIVHNTESIYGILVSLDDKAALIRANFIEGRLDYRRIFDEVNDRVIAPFDDGVDRRHHQGEGSAQAGCRHPGDDRDRLPRHARGRRRAQDGRHDRHGRRQDRSPIASSWRRPSPPASRAARSYLAVKRGEDVSDVKLTIPAPDLEVYVAGEPRLYGWVYNYANDVFWILAITYCIEWVLRWMYFHDWRGALRPTITGVIAAFWGLGFIHLIGLALDPLMLVMPFLITARAVSHAIQMHDRYYEEFERYDWNKRKAIVAAFAELFVPTFSGILTDAFGVLVIMLVPVIMLQKLAIVASWWILAITVSEMLLNPIVYYYLRAPEPEVVMAREKGWFRRLIDRVTDWNLSPVGKIATMVVLAGGRRRGPLPDARPHRRRPDVGLAAPLGGLAVQRLAQAHPGRSSAASSR